MSSINHLDLTPRRKRAASVGVTGSSDLPATPLKLPDLGWDDTPQSNDSSLSTPPSLHNPSNVHVNHSDVDVAQIRSLRQLRSARQRQIQGATLPEDHTPTERHRCEVGCKIHTPRRLFQTFLLPVPTGEKNGHSSLSYQVNIDPNRINCNFSSLSRNVQKRVLESSLGYVSREIFAPNVRRSFRAQQEPVRKKVKDDASTVPVKIEHDMRTITEAQVSWINAKDEHDQSQECIDSDLHGEEMYTAQITTYKKSANKGVAYERFSRILPFDTIDRLVEDPRRCVASLVRQPDRRCSKPIKSFVGIRDWLLNKLSTFEAPLDFASAQSYIRELTNMVNCTGRHRSIATRQLKRLLNCSDEGSCKDTDSPGSKHDFSKADMDFIPVWLEALTRVPAKSENGSTQLNLHMNTSRDDSESPTASQSRPGSVPISIKVVRTAESIQTTEITQTSESTQTTMLNEATETTQTTTEATQTTESSDTTEVNQAVETTQAGGMRQVSEATQIIIKTAQTTESTKIAQVGRATESTQTGEVYQATEATQTTMESQAIEMSQAIETTHTTIRVNKAADTTRSTEGIETTKTSQTTESTQTTEVNRTAKSTQPTESPGFSASTKSTQSTKKTQTAEKRHNAEISHAAGSSQTTESSRTSESVESTQTIESVQTTGKSQTNLTIQTINSTQTVKATQKFRANVTIEKISFFGPLPRTSTHRMVLRNDTKQAREAKVQYLNPFHQRFEPFSTKASDGVSVGQWIHDRLTRPLTRREIDVEGLIYMYWHRGNFGFVKIGMTTRETTAERLKEWERQCRHEVEEHIGGEVKMAMRLPHVFRVEALVHAELKDARLAEIKCEGCGKRHEEWFAVSPAYAKKVIEKWSAWVTTGSRYEPTGACYRPRKGAKTVEE